MFQHLAEYAGPGVALRLEPHLPGWPPIVPGWFGMTGPRRATPAKLRRQQHRSEAPGVVGSIPTAGTHQEGTSARAGPAGGRPSVEIPAMPRVGDLHAWAVGAVRKARQTLNLEITGSNPVRPTTRPAPAAPDRGAALPTRSAGCKAGVRLTHPTRQLDHHADVAQWQSIGLPNRVRGFDSRYPLWGQARGGGRRETGRRDAQPAERRVGSSYPTSTGGHRPWDLALQRPYGQSRGALVRWVIV